MIVAGELTDDSTASLCDTPNGLQLALLGRHGVVCFPVTGAC